MKYDAWKKTALATSMLCALGAAPLWAVDGPAEPVEEDSLATMINKHVSLSGVIELEASWGEDFEGVSESTVELATAEVWLEAQMSSWAQGILGLEWDGDDDKITVAEAFITVGDSEKSPLSFTGGRLAVPFGSYETNMISDPLTLDIGETVEDALVVGFEQAGFSGSVYVFNGETNEGGGNESIEHYGLSLGYSVERDDLGLEIGVGYISSLLDSDGLTDAMADGMETDYVGGLAAHVVAGFGDVVLIGEYVAGLDDAVEVSAADEVTNHSKPAAWNLEAAYTFGASEVTAAAAMQGTKNLGGILPELRLVATVGFGLDEGLSLAFQYAHDEDYDVAEGGTGEAADSATAKLAYEF